MAARSAWKHSWAMSLRYPSDCLARGHVVNLCRDRYRFAVGFAAALCRRQVNLLPPNDMPGMLDQLATDYPDVYCLTDGERPDGPAIFPYPSILPHDPAAHLVPRFPADQLAAVLFTSGSTGRPQPHGRSWGDLVNRYARSGSAARHWFAARGVADWYRTASAQLRTRIPPDARTAARVGAARRAAILPGRYCRGACRCAASSGAGDHAAPLAGSAGGAGHHALRLTWCSQQPRRCRSELAREAEQRFAGTLYEIYGCSEAGQIAVRRTALTQEWRCLDGIVLRQDAAGTWASGIPIAEETLLSDVIELHDHARFSLHGRIADLVNVAGKRTSLAHLNHHLNAIEGVLDGALLPPLTTATPSAGSSPSLSRLA